MKKFNYLSLLNLNALNPGLGKLASIMANKGQGLMSEQAWNELHSEPTTEYDASFYRKKELKNSLI